MSTQPSVGWPSAPEGQRQLEVWEVQTAPHARAPLLHAQTPAAVHEEPLGLQSAFEKHRRAHVRVSGSQPKSPGQGFVRQSVGRASQRPALQTSPA